MMTPKTPSTVTTCTRLIGSNRGKARLWIEGAVLSTQGWEKGVKFVNRAIHTDVSDTLNYIRIEEPDNYQEKDLRKVAGTDARPIIDTNTDTLLTTLGVKVGDRVTITINREIITIRKFNPETDDKPEAMAKSHQPVREFKPGDRVMIYEDPLTEQKPEGIAVLVKHIHESNGIETWKVRFVQDGSGAPTLARRIKTPACK